LKGSELPAIVGVHTDSVLSVGDAVEDIQI